LKASEKIQRFFDQLKEKHKLTFINDTNYHERWSFRVSSLNLYTLLLLYTIIIIIVLMLLFKYTALSGIFATKEDSVTQNMVEENTRSLDSLYEMTESTEKYLNNLTIVFTLKVRILLL